MGDIDKLKPEVRGAFAICNAQLPDHDSDGTPNAWYYVRAELLRLATIEADALIALDCEHDWQVEHKRAEKAELLRLDAARYRWLRDTQTTFGVSAQYNTAGKPIFHVRLHGFGASADDVDAAIDAAMAKESGNG